MVVSKTRKWNMAGLAILLLAGTAVAFFPYYRASQEMHRFCSELATGASLAEVQSKAAVLGYEVSPLVDGRAIVEDPVSYGRRTCELEFDEHGLVSSSNP